MAYLDFYSMPNFDDYFFFDMTAESRKDGGRISTKKTPRSMSKVNGLCLHQTGVPTQASGNDPWKYRGVRTHFVITPDGSLILNHEPEIYCNASDKLNKLTVAVEFVGNFRSERGTWWGGDKYGKDHLTDEQVMAGRYLVLYCRDVLNLSNVYCHRQSNKGKNCCGPDVWYHVGQWAVDVLGLGDGGTKFHVEGGAAIPEKWRTWAKAP